jgi:TonB family protein
LNIIPLICRLPIVLVMLFTVTIGSVLAQTPGSNSELEPAIKLLRERRTKEALDAFKSAVSKNKANPDAWYFMGLSYLQLGDFKKASSVFQTAIKLRPNLAGAHAGYGYALLRRGKLKDATRETQKALSLDPKHIDALYTMGVISLRQGARDEALKYADAIIAVNPNMAAAYLIRSQAYVRFNGDALVSEAGAPKDERLRRYRLAAEALEQYLKLEADKEEAQVWKDQLESLKFYVADKSGAPRVYSGREVTTKARLLSKPEPVYTEKARQEQVTGTVVLKCVFAGDGSVKHILVVESLPHGLTEASIAAARRIKFEPATLDGKPVSMFMQLEYNFNLY